MTGRKWWYILTLLAFALLPLAGCGIDGGTSTARMTQGGTEVTVNGQVSSSGVSAAAAGDPSTVTVYDAQDGAVLGWTNLNADGSFSGLSFTLPSSKAILVFKAVVGTSSYRTILPIDLSNPPSGITTNNPINVVISQDSNAKTQLVTQLLGLSGYLADAGKTLNAVNSNYSAAATLVVNNGGQQLAYGNAGLALTGQLSNASLLPAKPATDLTYEDMLNIKLGGSISSASIPVTTPIVNFTVTDSRTGKGIKGLTGFNVHVAQLKADGSTWLNYFLQDVPANTRDRNFLPTTATYTVIDKGDGSYTLLIKDLATSNALVLSKKDTATASSAALTYDANAVHRIAISVSSAAPGSALNPATGAATSSFSNANVLGMVYDFVPATGAQYVNANGGNYARDVVTMAACDACHGQFSNHGHHFGSRPDTKICVVCHTVQNKRTGLPSAEFTSLIHTLHMGEELPVAVTNIAGVDASEIKFPQDARNCTTCHKGKDVNNWKTKASANACQACHNNVDAVAGTNHAAGPQTNCVGCHADASLVHLTDVATPNNPNVPAGVKTLKFELTDVSVDASSHPVLKFKPYVDGALVTFNTYVDATSVMVTGLTGSGPNLYVAYARPQDGINEPADFNVSQNKALDTIWKGTNGSLTGPVNGEYTATITAITIPADAKMVTGAISGYGTFSNNGVQLAFQAVSKTATGYTARRAIVTTAKCNACHEQLGTKPNFHNNFGNAPFGTRNDATACAICHTVNRANNGWAVNASTFIHALHGASKRTVPYTWHKAIDEVTTSPTYGQVTWTGENIGYPGILRNCEQCHVAGSYDYTNTVDLAGKMLFTTAASGTMDGTSTLSKAANMAPYVVSGTNYGSGYSGSDSTIAPVDAAATTLVSSPISAACFSCHDSATAVAHMKTNGGSVYEARSTALAKQEACLVCHGPRGADTTLPVTGSIPTIKNVHRWW